MQIEKGFTGNWLRPTGAQQCWMRQFAGHKRFVWNRALSIEQARYRRGEKALGCARWILSVQCTVEIPDLVHANKTIVAGDFGIVHRVTFSDGVVAPPMDVSREEQRKAFWQRQLKNKTKFGSNWKEIVRKISKLDSRMANLRKDQTHKFTTRYSKNHAVIVLGDLDIKSMSVSAAGTIVKPGKNVAQKSGLNRSILRQGWGALGRQLEYKERWRGGLVEYQSEAYTRQECPACRHRSPNNRKTQSDFICVECGFSGHADEVAAQNQLQKFLSSDKGVALLASGYRASVNSLWSGRSGDSATKQEPIEEIAQMRNSRHGIPRIHAGEDVKIPNQCGVGGSEGEVGGAEAGGAAGAAAASRRSARWR